jgi:hypothetical protein
MAVQPRDDGLFDVTDDYGGVVLSEVPGDMLPQELILDPYAGRNVRNPVTALGSGIVDPWQTEQDPSTGLPPEAIAGPGGGPVDPAALTQAIQTAGQPPVQNFDPSQFTSGTMPGASAPEAAPATMSPPVAPSGPAVSRTGALLSGLTAQAVRGSPGMRTAGGDVLQGYSVERQSPLSEEGKAGMEKAMLGSAMAAQYAGDTLSVAQREAGEQYAARREQATTELDQLRVRQQQEGMVLAEQMGVVRERAQEAREARATFNPSAYWDEKGALGGFAARIGIALGAIGAGIAGGPNQVYQMVKDDIQGNIEGQRLKIEDAQAGIDVENSILAQMRTQFLSPEAAEAAARSLMAEAAAAQTLEVAAAVGSQEALANSKLAVAKVQADAAQWAAEAEQLEAGAIRETFKHVPAGYTGGQAGGLAGLVRLSKQTGIPVLELIQLNQGEAMLHPGQIGKPPKEEEAKAESEKLFVPGYGFARDAKSADAARELAASSSEAVRIMNRLDILRETGAKQGAFGVGSDEYNEAKTLRQQLVSKMSKIYAGGFNPSIEHEKTAEGAVPDPTSWRGSYEAKAKGLRTGIGIQTEEAMKQKIKVRTPQNYVPEGER